MVDDFGINLTIKVQKRIGKTGQVHKSADHVGPVGLKGHHLARLFLGGGQCIGRRLDILNLTPAAHMGHQLAIPSNNKRGGQRADGGLRGQEPDKPVDVGGKKILRPVNILAHGRGIGANDLRMLLQIGFGHTLGIVDNCAGALGKPGVQPAIQGDAGKHRHQNRRHHRNHGKQGDQAHMQPRPGAAPAPGQPNLVDLPADQPDKAQNQGQIGNQQPNHHFP